jgi:hypothetical protein
MKFETFFELSPSMVQLKRDSANYCEWGIAMTSECATIGSVQERFLASHGTRIHPVSRIAGQGLNTAIRQVLISNSTVSISLIVERPLPKPGR